MLRVLVRVLSATRRVCRGVFFVGRRVGLRSLPDASESLGVRATAGVGAHLRRVFLRRDLTR